MKADRNAGGSNRNISMSKVFISSVIKDFEEFRAAARDAIELMGHRAVMAEKFGARPYSSEVACVTEVQQADVYIVVLGKRYGFVTGECISVTEAEFNAARASVRPVLAFVQNDEMEAEQERFAKRVQDYAGGSFRASFSSPAELKDEVIKALRSLEAKFSAVGQVEFERRIASVIDELDSGNQRHEPRLIVAMWPQPPQPMNIFNIEKQLDARFNELATAGLVTLRHGYEPLKGSSWTGLKSHTARCLWLDDGLRLVIYPLKPDEKDDWSFASYYVSPSLLENRLLGTRKVVNMHGGWCYAGLRGMDQARVEEPPKRRSSSMTMRMYGKNSDDVFELLIPLTDERYKDWIDRAIGRFVRTFN
jgi:hypothetical protein